MDEHLRRVVSRLYDVREEVRLGKRPAGDLLGAARAAELAIDHAHPDWMRLLQVTTLRVDSALTPWPPVGIDDDRRAEALEASKEFAASAEQLLYLDES